MHWDDLPSCTLHLYLRDNVFLGCWCRLSAHKHSVVWMTAFTAALQELLKWTQPATNQVDVLQGHESKGMNQNTQSKSSLVNRVLVTRLDKNISNHNYSHLSSIPSCDKTLGLSIHIFRVNPSLFQSDLQYNPVTLLGSLFHGNLSHSFLALAQGHVVELSKVDSKTQLPSWEHSAEF